MLCSFRAWLSEHINPGGFFNSDASQEIDRLTSENEVLREELAELHQIIREAVDGH